MKNLLFWVSSFELNIWNKKAFKKFSVQNQIPLVICFFEFEKCENFIIVEHGLYMDIIWYYCVIKTEYLLIDFFFQETINGMSASEISFHQCLM